MKMRLMVFQFSSSFKCWKKNPSFEFDYTFYFIRVNDVINADDGVDDGDEELSGVPTLGGPYVLWED